MAARDEKPVTLRITYPGAEDVPILYANQFIVQFHQDEFILTVAQLAPPLVVGEPEEQREQARRMAELPANVVARLAFTRTRLAELIDVLQTSLGRYDQAQKTRQAKQSTRRRGR